MKRIRYGVIGMKGVGQYHLEFAQRNPHVDVASNFQYGIAGSEFTARAELVEAHSPFDKLRANGDSPK
jgi:predicted dehydrogenase